MLATSIQRISNPRFLSEMASYEVAGIIHRTLYCGWMLSKEFGPHWAKHFLAQAAVTPSVANIQTPVMYNPFARGRGIIANTNSTEVPSPPLLRAYV